MGSVGKSALLAGSIVFPVIAAANAAYAATAYSTHRAVTKKLPPPPEAVAAPKVEDKAVQQAAAEATARRTKGLGYRGTILSQMGNPTGLKDTMGS